MYLFAKVNAAFVLGMVLLPQCLAAVNSIWHLWEKANSLVVAWVTD